MNQTAFLWIVAVSGSMVSGFAVVCLLVAPRRLESFAAAIAIAGGAASAYALARVGVVYQRADAILYAFAFALAGLGGGYALASTLLFRLAHPLSPPPVFDDDPPRDPRAAVLVTCCVEPPRYNPASTARMLLALTDEGLLEASIGGLPFLFFAHKTRYKGLDDRSPSLSQLVSVAERLQAALIDEAVVVDWATCSGPDRLPVKVAAALRRGHRRVLVANLAVATSVQMESARLETDALHPEAYGASVVDITSISSSDRIPELLVKRVQGAAGDAAAAGVVLVGHGQPEERARRRPAFGEAETVFMSRLRLLLNEHGVPNDRVRIAWSEWMEPGVTSEVRHLAALGCERIIVVPAVFPLDTLSTSLDLGLAARHARVEDSVQVTVLPGWGADDIVVDELKRLVLETVAK